MDEHRETDGKQPEQRENLTARLPEEQGPVAAEQPAEQVPAEEEKRKTFPVGNETVIDPETPRLYCKSLFGPKFWFAFYSSLLMICVGIVIVALDGLDWLGGLMLAVFGILSILMGISYGFGRAVWGKGAPVWQQRAVYRYTFAEEGVHAAWEGESDSGEEERPYRNLLRAEESRNYLALFWTAEEYWVISKAGFEEGDFAALAERLRAVLGKKYLKVR